LEASPASGQLTREDAYRQLSAELKRRGPNIYNLALRLRGHEVERLARTKADDVEREFQQYLLLNNAEHEELYQRHRDPTVLKFMRALWNTDMIERFRWTSELSVNNSHGVFATAFFTPTAILKPEYRDICNGSPYQEGDPECRAAITTREVDSVTGIRQVGQYLVVEFSVTNTPTKAGIALKLRETTVPATGAFIKYDDGWRLVELNVQSSRNLMLLARRQICKEEDFEVIISKSTFLNFQICPKDTWLRLHRPDLVDTFAATDFEKHLLEQGNEVEAHARRLFPDGILISSSGEEAEQETRRLMDANADTIFQATFLADGFYCKCDVLKRGAAPGTWDIYEIKGTNSRKEGSEERDHISDLAFQRHVLRRAGVTVDRVFIIHLSKEYVRRGDLDVQTLFTIADSTELVDAVSDRIEAEMQMAADYLAEKQEPTTGCDCHLYGRSRHCRTFTYSHPHIPPYSVHDITRIGQSRKKLRELMDMGIREIGDVPDDYKLTEPQLLQVRSHKTQQPIVNAAVIADVLNVYKFPLYFLDYETFAPAIPAFEGFGPYKRIPFQLSLHIVRDPDQEPEHIEFLHPDRSDPTLAIARLLDERIGPEGTVVVWSAPFERGVNKEIGERLSGNHAVCMDRINGQMRDLRDIFSKQHYVHPSFRGGTSIKDVLPIMVPELSYEGMDIRDGTTASERWWAMTAADTPEAERAAIAASLLAYCKLDSYAMFAIWRALRTLSGSG
jgi:hypothetical protein